jgi:hypothetical protein
MGSRWYQLLRWWIEGWLYPLHCKVFGHQYRGYKSETDIGTEWVSVCEFCCREQTEE